MPQLFSLPRAAALFTAIGLSLGMGSYANADDFTVTTLQDTNNSSDGLTSLREAMTLSNTSPGADTIRFADALTGTINLFNALPALSGQTTIEGPGARLLAVRRSASVPTTSTFRIFTIGSAGVVTLSGLTISHGYLGPTSGSGGGISSEGTITVRSCVVRENTAFNGGGIWSHNTLTIENSTISENRATGAVGGVNSHASIGGRKTIIRNSTISGNIAGTNSGGVSHAAGTLEIQNSTITSNISRDLPAGLRSFTTEPWAGTNTVFTHLANTIIAGNLQSDSPGTGTTTPGIDVHTNPGFDGSGSIISAGYNVIGTGDTLTLSHFNGTNDVTGVANPKLGSLQNNGGPTNTHLPAADSPAVNIGGTTALTTDQRGAGYPRVSGALDAGAVERANDSLIVTTFADEDNSNSDPLYGSGTSLREAINYANSRNGADTITFAEGLFPGGNPAVINLATSLPSLRGELVIAGPGARKLTVRRAESAANFPVFFVQWGTVTLSGLTISHGYQLGTGNGGGIKNYGNLTVQFCAIKDNAAQHGGGIWSEGALTVENSTLSGNRAYSVSAIYTESGTDFTLSKAVIRNSTISGNSATGGGTTVENYQGLLQIQHSTITNNLGSSSRAGLTSNYVAGVRTEVSNSIIAGNLLGVAPGSPGGDVYTNGVQDSNGFVSGGHNVIGTGNTFALDRFLATQDVQGITNPKLGPLQNNGGPTDTHALLNGSPAYGRGGSTTLNTDQRGPGFPRVRGTLDSGAYEGDNQAPTATNQTVKFDSSVPKTVTLKAADPNGDPLTYTILTSPTRGTLGAVNGGQITYTPNAPFSGTDTFTLRVSDGGLNSNIATVTMQATAPPTLESFVLSTLDGTPISNGNKITAKVPYKFSLTVKDEDGTDNIRSVYLTFNKLLTNSGGAALAYDRATNKLSLRDASGNVVAGQISGTEAVQDNGLVTLDFHKSSVAKDEVAKTITVTWVITPGANFTGVKGLWAQVKDGAGAVDGWDQLGTWTVEPDSSYVSKIKALDGTAILKPGVTSLALILPFENPDNMPLAFSIVDGPARGTLGTVSGNRVTYTLGSDFAATGRDSFTFKINDGKVDSNIATFTVKYNGAPLLGELFVEKVTNPDGGSSSAVNEPLRLSLTVSDEDGVDNIRMVYLTFNRILTNSGGAALSYDRSTNKLALRDASGNVVAGQSPETEGTYSNGLVTLDFKQSSVVKNVAEKTLTVNWVLTPGPSFTGVKGLWAQVKDGFSLTDGWDSYGNWTINPALVTLKAPFLKPSTTTY